MSSFADNPTRPPVDATTAEIGPVAARVARGLFTRYLGVFAALAGLIVTAAVLPSRVVHHATPAAVGRTAAAGGATRADDSGGGKTAVTSGPPAPSGVMSLAAPGPGAAPLTPSTPPPGSAGEAVPPTPDGSPCPVGALGPKPAVSPGVAATLLGAASPGLAALGPLSPDAVPALALVSPLLPVIAPLADKGGPYLTPLFPIFVQLTQLESSVWEGPLQPAEPTLLDFNDKFVVPYELALLGALGPVPAALNDSPVVPCGQVLAGQVAKLIPPPPGS